MPRRRVRLRRRVQVLALAFVALIGLDVLAAVRLTVIRDRTTAVVDEQLAPADAAVSSLLNALISQETGQRGYIITGSQPQLTAYTNGIEAGLQSIKMLRANLRDKPVLLEGVERSQQAISDWQKLVAQPEIDARTSGGPGEAPAMVVAESQANLFEKATDRIDEVRRGVNVELTRAEQDRDHARALTTRILVASLVIGLAVLVITRFLITRWITRPLEDLQRSVAQVAGGDLDHVIERVGPPDLDDLAVGVEAMRRRILTELDDADRARGALARRGLVVLTLRDELAPSKVPLPDTWSLVGRFEPAEGILAGDWYDVVALGDGRFAFALVDVAGHGAATGVYALRTKQLVQAALRQGLSPAATWAWVQQAQGDTGEQFLTGAIVVVDPPTGRLLWASAGHPELLLVNRKGIVSRLEANGPLVGGVPGPWEEAIGLVEPGGFLVAYTDGLVEVRDEAGEEFGTDRLIGVVAEAAGQGADAVADACMAAARRHAAGRFIDDVTLVVLGHPR